MSGLMSAVGRGVSAAGYAAGDLFARQALMQAQSEEDLERAKRLEEFKQMLQDRSRQAQVARIETATGTIADQAVADKRGVIESGIVDRSAWTQEQQNVVDQQLATDRNAVASDPRTKLIAMSKTGDLSAKDEVLMDREDRRLDVAERAAARKEAFDREREDRRDAREIEREDRRDARQQAAIEAAERRLGRQLTAAEQRAELRLSEGRVPSGYRKKADGTLEAIPGGPATIGKALPTKLVNDLVEQATITDSTERLLTRFKPEFAGKTIAGEMSNTAGRILGDESGQAEWWQDYSLHEATVRNKLFGASLTASEQGQWTKLTVTPRMNSNEVKKNLQRRAEIEQRALDRLTSSTAKAGYNKEQIEAVVGRPIPENSGDATGGWQDQGGPKPGSVQDGYRYLGGDPGDRKNWAKVKP